MAAMTVFRPKRGRYMAYVMIIAQSLLMLTIAFGLKSHDDFTWTWPDRIGVLLISVAISAALWRVGNVRAIATESGLTVVNVVYRTELQWAQIVNVRFGGADPWVTLDLGHGDSMSVMAIQSADGDYANDAAQRLADLVANNSHVDRP